jgi:hypothetical protein
MAIKKTTQTSFGIEVANAYHRVEGLRIIGKDQISFQVRSYKDNSGLPHFADAVASCAYALDGANPIEQAYEHLKTLPEFAGAIDC